MYQSIDPRKTNELFIQRNGWFNAIFELTDRACNYGSLSYKWLSRRTGYISTSAGSFSIGFDGFFTRNLVIMNEQGEKIGTASREIFSFETTLTMNDGFQAKFYLQSIWSREYVWESSLYGPIMRIKSPLLSFTSNVYLQQSTARADILPLLVFLGQHLIILRKRRKATAH